MAGATRSEVSRPPRLGAAMLVLMMLGAPADLTASAADPCAAPSARDGDPCDDGNPCTLIDTCLGGLCVGGDPKACPAPDQCLLAGTCDPETGACAAFPPRPNGSPCDDGDGCTQSDTCLAGVCLGTDPIVCAEDEFACTETRCRDGVCEHVPLDERCQGDGCATPACLPSSPLAEAGTGCIRTRPVPNVPQTLCGEDGDPCTDDVCLDGLCAHRDVAEGQRCDSVRMPYDQALGLRAAGEDLRAAVAGLLPDARHQALRGQLQDRLGEFVTEVEAIQAILAGRATTTSAGKTVAERRVRAALPAARRLVPALRAALRMLARARRTEVLTRAEARTLATRVQRVLAQTRSFERTLRRVRRISRIFAAA